MASLGAKVTQDASTALRNWTLRPRLVEHVKEVWSGESPALNPKVPGHVTGNF